MTGSKKLEHTAIWGFVVQLGFLIVCIWLYAKGVELTPDGGEGGRKSLALLAECQHLAVGLVLWGLVFFHGRARRRAAEEREEREHLRSVRLSEEIFDDGELDTVSAGSVLRVFEKYVVTVAAFVLGAGLIFLSVRLILNVSAGNSLLRPDRIDSFACAATGVVMVFVAFGGFVIGRLAAGLSQSPELRLLRAAGGYMLGNVLAALMIMVAMALCYFGVTGPERIVAYAVPALMGLVGVEILLNLLLDIYRPRVEGQERRPAYDSRVLGLLAEPGSVFETVSSTLDYQFGFKVSDTWFYQMVQRALMPLILIQVLALWALSCVLVIEPDEIAIIERFGVPRLLKPDRAENAALPSERQVLADQLADLKAARTADAAEIRRAESKLRRLTDLRASIFEPGFYLKLPWPMDVAHRVPAYKQHDVPLGKTYKRTPLAELMKAKLEMSEEGKMLLWSEQHIDARMGSEEYFLTPAQIQVVPGGPETTPGEKGRRAPPPVNLARMEAQLYFSLRSDENGLVDKRAAYDYYYRQANLLRHVDLLAYRAVSRIAAGQDLLAWMGAERGPTNVRLKALIQNAFDDNELGLVVDRVAITALQPPVEAHKAFEDVVRAASDGEVAINTGKWRRLNIFGMAKSMAINVVSQARLELIQKQARRTARSEAFKLTTAFLAARGGGFEKALDEATSVHEESLKAEGGKLSDSERKAFRSKLSAQLRANLFDVFKVRQYSDALENGLPGHKVTVVPPTGHEVNVIDIFEKHSQGYFDVLKSQQGGNARRGRR
jgi:regulator of protease activity HflC (stomatin/prohibitin superfamily)